MLCCKLSKSCFSLSILLLRYVYCVHVCICSPAKIHYTYLTVCCILYILFKGVSQFRRAQTNEVHVFLSMGTNSHLYPNEVCLCIKLCVTAVHRESPDASQVPFRSNTSCQVLDFLLSNTPVHHWTCTVPIPPLFSVSSLSFSLHLSLCLFISLTLCSGCFLCSPLLVLGVFYQPICLLL